MSLKAFGSSNNVVMSRNSIPVIHKFYSRSLFFNVSKIMCVIFAHIDTHRWFVNFIPKKWRLSVPGLGKSGTTRRVDLMPLTRSENPSFSPASILQSSDGGDVCVCVK